MRGANGRKSSLDLQTCQHDFESHEPTTTMTTRALILVLAAVLLPTDSFVPKPRYYDTRCSSGAGTRQGSSNDDDSLCPHIIFPGGGIYFYWQAGVATYLKENGYNLEQATMTGASAGALTATLAATNVDFYQATDLALELARRSGVWDRSGGLQGIWGGMIYEWLQELIEPSAVETLGDSRLSVLVTKVPNVLQKVKVSSFHDKADLIQANMASIHLPWFLNSKLTTDFRGNAVMDGSFLAKPTDYTAHDDRFRKSVIVDYKMDPKYRDQSLLSFIETVEPSKIIGMLEDGKRYAKQLENEGYFEALRKVD